MGQSDGSKTKQSKRASVEGGILQGAKDFREGASVYDLRSLIGFLSKYLRAALNKKFLEGLDFSGSNRPFHSDTLEGNICDVTSVVLC